MHSAILSSLMLILRVLGPLRRCSMRAALLAGCVLHGARGPTNPDAIARVVSGQETTADAAWWGFDPDDATEAIQAAIRSPARKVIVPVMPSPWVIRPIELRSNLELEFQAGVLVLAKAGEFRGGGDSLFRAVDRTNLVVRGYGAELRMRKRDYQQPPYPPAEWRMGLHFTGCRHVRVEGLKISSTGGDGIYVGSSRTQRWCEDVIIRDCVCDDNHRQGISVISAVNLLVERCTLSGTAGTAPEAGIDFEPDEPDERLVNCVVRQCQVVNNRGNGILVYLRPLTRESAPVSVRFEDCHVRTGALGQSVAEAGAAELGGWSGIAVGKVRDDGPTGLVEFIRCTSENTGREAVRIFDKSATGVRVRFEGCRWKQAWVARHQDFGGPRVPILFRCQDSQFSRRIGGVEFADCAVFDRLDGATVRFENDDGVGVLNQVSGQIAVKNAQGIRMLLGPQLEGVRLELRRAEGAP